MKEAHLGSLTGMGMPIDTFVEELETGLNAPGRDRREHPFVNAVSTGTATGNQIAGWLHQFVSWADPSNKLLGVAYANCPDEDIREGLMEAILEEEHGHSSNTAGHVELIGRTLAALGWDKQKCAADEMRLESWCFRHWLEVVVRNRSFIEAITSLSFAAERLNPAIFKKIETGLRKHYDLSDDALLSISVHASDVEEEHGTMGPAILRRYATSEHMQSQVRFAVYHTAELYYRSYDVWKYY
jgi:pyrroloquinoline quinone (PQQ) biosynthesis protein C